MVRLLGRSLRCPRRLAGGTSIDQRDDRCARRAVRPRSLRPDGEQGLAWAGLLPLFSRSETTTISATGRSTATMGRWSLQGSPPRDARAFLEPRHGDRHQAVHQPASSGDRVVHAGRVFLGDGRDFDGTREGNVVKGVAAVSSPPAAPRRTSKIALGGPPPVSASNTKGHSD